MTGNNIIVFTSSDNGANWTAIAATRSDEIQVDGEMIPIASSAQADKDWQRVICGKKSWTLQTSRLVTALTDIRKVLDVGTRVKIRICGRTYSASSAMEGYAIVKTCKLSAPINNIANGSTVFHGDGALT